MPSSKYALFEEAMRTGKQVTCMYQGPPREVCPIILGHSQGKEKALTYQFAGRSSQGLPAEGAWRCLFLAEVSDIQLREGPWISGSRHTLPSTCVEEVDLDVSPNSPYRPKRRIA